jgi:hypothetical protein
MGHRETDMRPGPSVLEVKYEDLVSRPESTVRQVCEFLGEDFEERMLVWQNRADEMIPARERKVHQQIGREMNARNVAVWKTRLSAWECFLMEAHMHVQLEKLGYPLRFSGARWRAPLWFGGALLSSFGPVLARAVPALQRRRLVPQNIYL